MERLSGPPWSRKRTRLVGKRNLRKVGANLRVCFDARQGIERLIEYLRRCPFSQARIIEVTTEGKVLYKTEHNPMDRFPEVASEDL